MKIRNGQTLIQPRQPGLTRQPRDFVPGGVREHAATQKLRELLAEHHRIAMCDVISFNVRQLANRISTRCIELSRAPGLQEQPAQADQRQYDQEPPARCQRPPTDRFGQVQVAQRKLGRIHDQWLRRPSAFCKVETGSSSVDIGMRCTP